MKNPFPLSKIRRSVPRRFPAVFGIELLEQRIAPASLSLTTAPDAKTGTLHPAVHAKSAVTSASPVAGGASGTSYTWDAGGRTDTSWFNPLNWSPDGIPGSVDTATLDTNATITLPSSTSVGTYIHLNPTVAGSNATLTISTGATLTVIDDFQWNQGGTENGAGTMLIAAGATLHFGTSSITAALSQRTINIQGTAIFPNGGFGTIAMSNGATINNSGTMDFQGQFVFSGTGTINNLAGGTLKNSTSNHTVIISSGPGVSFTNAGTVRVETGTLGFNGGYVQTAGSSQMVGGAFNIGSSPLLLNGGELSGTGSFLGNITNNGGVVRPGGTGATGTLTTNGSYLQAAGGTLETEIAGASAGQFDVFALAGSAQLAGALSAPLLGGFSPAAGSSFRVLTASGIAGTFASTPPALTPQYNAQNVTLLGPTVTTPFVVTTATDIVSATDGVVSLREAITSANSTPGVDTISFNIAGSGVKTITLSTALPALTEAAVIDGYTQPGSSANTLATGSNAVLNVVLAGTPTLGNGLTLSASGVTVRGLVVQGFNDGIAINGANAVIAGNWIGVAASGTAAAANADDGIQIGAANAVIGGIAPAARNVISGNGGSGIEMTAGATGVKVQGNYLGTNPAGSAALGNSADGITLLVGANGNVIGGLTAAERNVISGNVARGVLIFSNTNVVQGNYIGTDATGLFAVKNRFDGLTIAAPGSNNDIGGAAAGARNVISGNDIAGVTIESINTPAGPATGNRVQGNYIGVAADGTTALGNTAGSQRGWGVGIFRAATGNLIGGTAAGEGNVIANNAGAGAAVLDAGPVGNRISGNSIFANGDLGIDLGSYADPANSVLANDVGDGDSGGNNLLNSPLLTAAIPNSSATQISGSYNGVANQTFTIELFANTASDPSGAGEGRTFLGATSVATDASGNGTFTFAGPTLAVGSVISATATQTAAGTSEFARNILVAGTPSTVVTTALDVVSATDGVVSLREAIIFANSNAGLDTITFNIPGSGVKTLTLASALPAVTETAVIDGYSQPGASANTLAVGNDAQLRIVLAGTLASGNGLTISGAGVTVSGLVIQNFANGIVVNANGAVISGNWIGLTAAGTGAAGNTGAGVILNSTGAVVGGVGGGFGGVSFAARNVISGNGDSANPDLHNGAGVLIQGTLASNNRVLGNYIGTNATGTAAVGNLKSGVAIYDGATLNVVGSAATLGGDGRVPRNVISGNLGHGVDIAFGSNTNTISNDFIGTNAAGLTALGNGGAGVLINFTSNGNRIGGVDTNAGNVIAANAQGIVIAGGSFATLVDSNFVGTNSAGTTGLGNTGPGIRIEDSPGNTIGNSSVPNVVGGNAGHGIELTGTATKNNLVQNNFAGLTPTTFPGGARALPNALAGIALLNGANTNDIGGTARGNDIAGNTGDGVLLNNASNNLVRGNRIGHVQILTQFIPNGGAGVHVIGGTGNRIGSPLISELNGILHNAGPGILVEGNGAVVTARGNVLEGNGGLGLDLRIASDPASGVTPNDTTDADAGPNTLLNSPTLTSAVRTAGSSGYDYVVSGSYSGTPNTTVTIDLYASPAADLSGFGEGQFVIQSFSVATDIAGVVNFARTFTGPVNASFFGVPVGPAITAQATLGNGASGPSSEFSAALSVNAPTRVEHLFFTGQALGARVEIRQASTGEIVRTFAAFDPGFTGGVRVAGGDVNGDGFEDVIVGAGQGGGARLRVFDGRNTSHGSPVLLYDFLPFGNGYRGGLFVAAGDVDGDGKADIVVAPSAGSSGTVKIFSGADGTLRSSFLAFGRSAGGVHVAAGDINGDGHADIIAGAGTGSIVRVFDGQNTATVLKEFRAFPAAYRSGVTVAAGDVNGDGLADVIVGTASGANLARVFTSGASGSMVEFNAFGGEGRGVNLATVDMNSDGIADIIAAQGRLAAPKVRLFSGNSVFTGAPRPALTLTAFPFDPGFSGGVFVG